MATAAAAEVMVAARGPTPYANPEGGGGSRQDAARARKGAGPWVGRGRTQRRDCRTRRARGDPSHGSSHRGWMGRCLAGGWACSVPWARPARPSPRPQAAASRPRPRPHRAPGAGPSARVFAQGLPFHRFPASSPHPDPEPRAPSPCPRLPPRLASRHPGPSTLPPGGPSPRSPEAALWTELLFLHVFVETRPCAFLGLPVRPPLPSQPRPWGKWRAAGAVLIGPKRGRTRGSWCREIHPPPPAALSWHRAAYSLPGRHRTRERLGAGTGCEARPL